ncbi:MAG: hypothetical protein P1U56_18180 [Saprospiraceae bacterium]|nr:hypothetical protein [Saprospiraceae bacterium]
MQPSYNDKVTKTISDIIGELNQNDVLSKVERDEIEDHFYCELDELTELGLMEEEALLIARKRFGLLEDVSAEYKKVSPQWNLMQYGIIGVVGYCLVCSITLFVNMISEWFWMLYYQVDPYFVQKNILLDIPMRFILVLICGLLLTKVISKMNLTNLRALWKIPILYVVLSLIQRGLSFVVLPSLMHPYISKHLELFAISNIVTNTTFAFILIVASIKLYKIRILELRQE